MNDQNNTLQSAAQTAGIDAVGVVNLDELKQFVNRIEPFQDAPVAFYRGALADKFDYKKIWNKTNSIISFAVSYQSMIQPPDDEINYGKIAKCAYGEDYHIVLRRKAETLLSVLKQRFGEFQYIVMVDDGKISDRACAYSAGIGFFGKNGFIIHPQYGSFIFLGTILTDLHLNENMQFIDSQCGNCIACIKECPNGALSEHFGFAYEKCISYQTQKGIQTDTKGYLYGCDICQDSCKFNRNAPVNLHSEFSSKSDLAFPDPKQIIAMGADRFKERYGKSSLYWRGYKTLRNNSEYMLTQLNCNIDRKEE